MGSARFSCRLPPGVEPVPLLGPARCGDRGGAGVAGEVAAGRERVDVAGVAQDDGGAERAAAVDVGQRGARGDNCLDDAFVDGEELVVEPTYIAQQLECHPLAFDLDRSRWPDAAQDPPGLGSRQQAASTARGQATEQGVKPTDRLGAQPSEVVVPVRQQTQHRGVIHRGDLAQPAVT
jgi:hypothetical protein